MIAICEKCMCTGVRDPRPYKINGREGVSYVVEISDGKGSVELPVISQEIYQIFEPFGMYYVAVNFEMVAQETKSGARMFPKCRIVDAGAVE